MLNYSDLLPEEEVKGRYDAGEFTYPDLLAYNKNRVLQAMGASETIESLVNELERQELERKNKVRRIKKTVPTSGRWRFIRFIEDWDDPYGQKKLKIMQSPTGKFFSFPA